VSDFGRPEAHFRVVPPLPSFFKSLEQPRSFRRDWQTKASGH